MNTLVSEQQQQQPGWLKPLINALLFQLCWLACVIGGDYWALAALLLMVIIHGSWMVEAGKLIDEVSILLPLISLGIAFDTSLMQLGWLGFNNHNSEVIPFWLMALWLAFACTLFHSLKAVISRPWLACVFGLSGAPWSYFLGDKLGSVEVTTNGLIAIGVFWAVLLLLVSFSTRRKL